MNHKNKQEQSLQNQRLFLKKTNLNEKQNSESLAASQNKEQKNQKDNAKASSENKSLKESFNKNDALNAFVKKYKAKQIHSVNKKKNNKTTKANSNLKIG